MKAILDANLVICPGENALLDATGAIWVKNQALAGVFSKARALELTLSVEWPYGHRYIRIWPTNVCACCGKHPHQAKLVLVDEGPPSQWRCERHVGRNPCAVDGCGRTRPGEGPLIDWALCYDHFRMVPRRLRDVERRLWRLQKKSGGWTETLLARYWRVWPRIVAAAKRAARGEGDLDLAAIEREFGAL